MPHDPNSAGTYQEELGGVVRRYATAQEQAEFVRPLAEVLVFNAVNDQGTSLPLTDIERIGRRLGINPLDVRDATDRLAGAGLMQRGEERQNFRRGRTELGAAWEPPESDKPAHELMQELVGQVVSGGKLSDGYEGEVTAFRRRFAALGWAVGRITAGAAAAIKPLELSERS